MRRLRLALALLILALALPVALLVGRALQSVAFEERVRHETVAARVFDEMERALSELLEREEARSVGVYGFYGWRDALTDDATRPPRSPLSHPAPEPYVIAHFQIDPDGSWHTPLRPRDPALAARYGDWPEPTEDRERVERGIREIESSVAPYWRRVAERKHELELEEAKGELLGLAAKEETDALRSIPAATRAKRAQSLMKDQLAEEEVLDATRTNLVAGKADVDTARLDDKKAGAKKSTYEVLQSFNRAAEQRRERKSVVTEAPRTMRAPMASPEANTEEELPSAHSLPPTPRLAQADEDAPSEGASRTPTSTRQMPTKASPPYSEPRPAAAPPPMAQPLPHAERKTYASPSSSLTSTFDDAGAMLEELRQRSRADRAVEGGEADLEDSAQSSPQGAGGRADVRAADPIRIVRDPMVGIELGPDRVMLYRTVLVDQQGYRQGLLIDAAALGDWLEQRVIAASPLSDSVALAFGSDPPVPAVPSDYYVSAHDFAEPFDALSARLAVEPLAGGRSADTIYALTALLVIVGFGGLLAVDRMVTVVVHFAERRNNFVAAVSHELKTPLTAIRMYGEMLRDGLVASEEKRQEYYGTISDESERLSRLIDNVLEFSRLEKGNREFNISAGPIGALVTEIAERMRPHVEREGFTLRIEVEPDLPPVRFDRDALFQMLFNLVDNAMKYAKGAERHEVVVRCGLDERGAVQLSVRDYGPGVSRRVLGKVFEPFFRGEDELTRTAKGSGIGLALVKELGESMGAAVKGSNAEEGGFRVSIEFPALPGARA